MMKKAPLIFFVFVFLATFAFGARINSSDYIVDYNIGSGGHVQTGAYDTEYLTGQTFIGEDSVTDNDAGYGLLYKLLYDIDSESGPNITIHSPVNQTTYNTSSVSLNISSSDNIGVAQVIYNYGTSDIVYTTVTSLSLSDGNYTLIATAKDISGNTKSSTIWFVINTTTNATTPLYGKGPVSPQPKLTHNVTVEEVDQVLFATMCPTNNTFIQRLTSRCRYTDNGVCDDGEFYLVDSDCKVTYLDVATGDILKTMWFIRFILILSIFYLVFRDKNKRPLVVAMLLALLLYNEAFIRPDYQYDSTMCHDIGFLMNAGHCIMPTNAKVGWLIGFSLVALVGVYYVNLFRKRRAKKKKKKKDEEPPQDKEPQSI